MYLRKNKGAASDFLLIKDVVERYCDAKEEETVLRLLVADHGITVTAQRSDAAVIGRTDGPPAQADLLQFHGLLCRQAASSQQGKGGAC